jgi:hypothetical protein
VHQFPGCRAHSKNIPRVQVQGPVTLVSSTPERCVFSCSFFFVVGVWSDPVAGVMRGVQSYMRQCHKGVTLKWAVDGTSHHKSHSQLKILETRAS